MSHDPLKQLSRMLAVGTPIVAIDSHDHPHTRQRLLAVVGEDRPVVNWNLADGFVGVNANGEAALLEVDAAEFKAASQAGAHAALHVARKLPREVVLIVENLHWFWDKPAVMQAVLNLREPFKGSKRCLVGLVLGAKIPADLQQSLSYVAEPLPDEATLAAKVEGIYKDAFGEEKSISAEQAAEIARDLRGTSPFRAEQLTAQSLNREGISRERIRKNAHKQINDTPGLSVESGEETFDDIGGLDAIREYLTRYFDGPRSPSVVVRIEEIEKALSGHATDSSGTSGDALGTLLTSMEDYRWSGILAYGVSGCGKSLVAKAAANEFGAKAIRFDLNACKGSLVGESERQIRQAMEVLQAIGGERVFFIASMNQIASLPPELRRRFSAGTWYFDVPSKAGRDEIWKICAEQYGVEYDGYDAENLTGADIRDIVQRAYELNCSTSEAACYHVPLCKAAPDAIGQSRSDAQGRYLDANHGGPYRDPMAVESQYDRSISLED